MRVTLQEVAVSVANLVDEKQQSYGDSHGKAGDVLEILYPDGVKVESYQEMLTLVRVLDKLFRIATDNDKQVECPWNDIMGYALLQTARHMKERE